MQPAESETITVEIWNFDAALVNAVQAFFRLEYRSATLEQFHQAVMALANSLLVMPEDSQIPGACDRCQRSKVIAAQAVVSAYGLCQGGEAWRVTHALGRWMELLWNLVAPHAKLDSDLQQGCSHCKGTQHMHLGQHSGYKDERAADVDIWKCRNCGAEWGD